MHQVEDLANYWEENPPVHLLAKWYLGFKHDKKRKPRVLTEEGLDQLVAQFGKKRPGNG